MLLPCEYIEGYPVFGQYINGGFHTGLDFKNPQGALVKSVIDATIIFVTDSCDGYGGFNPRLPGWCVWLGCVGKDNAPYVINYGHVETDRKHGDKIYAGDILGVVTKFMHGKNRQPHAHLGIRTGARLPFNNWGYVKTQEELTPWREPMQWLKENT